MLKYYICQLKYTEAILSNSTLKLLWFEITKMLIAVLKINLLCYYNFRYAYTFVPYPNKCPEKTPNHLLTATDQTLIFFAFASETGPKHVSAA